MSKEKIMIVEDERIVAEDLKIRLNDMKYQVTAIASSGEEALGKIAENAPEVILMDIRIKGDMDGIETAEAINKKYDIPIIYLTAYADEDTLQRAKITEPFGYILKPFDLSENLINSNIRMALYKHKAEKEKTLLIKKLQTALNEIKVLRGIVPICANCKKIRDDKGYWHQVETYLGEHLDADFSHAICPECAHELYPDLSEE